jgi:NAD(P)-dependent dehydrogenase (short-subunit alcohol dehydrogenase family)
MSQVVLITGCSSGFGLLTAVEAARRGHVVYAGLRDLSSGDNLRKASEDLEITQIQLDVTVAEQRTEAVSRILDEHNKIDALVNNAGVAVGGFLEMLDEDEIRQVFEVNVFAAWALTRECLPSMRDAGSGTIVMVSSRSGRMGFPGIGAYSASKFALEGMTESWRHELRPFGIQVALVEPGPYKTDIWHKNRHLGRNQRRETSPYLQMGDKLERYVDKELEKGAGDPVEVADRIVSLIGHPDPALRHPMGPGQLGTSLMLNWLPFSVFESMISRVLR